MVSRWVWRQFWGETINQVKAVLCILILLASLFFGCPASFVGAAESCDEWVAKVVSVQGVVQARRAGETEWGPPKCPLFVQLCAKADYGFL